MERHHFSCLLFAARDSHAFQIFRLFRLFSILNPMVSYPSTTARFFNILTPVVANYDPFDPPMLVFISDFHVIVPTSLPLTFGPAEKEGLASRAGHVNMRWNAGNGRSDWSDWSDWYAGWDVALD